MNITLDLNAKTTHFPHYWEHCVGSCHAATGLRADWQAQLIKAKRDLGFRYIRFHGLFDDDMSACFKPMFFGTEVTYSFHNIDLLFDFLLSIGIKPFVELGFMPTALASGPDTCFHYKANVTPPADYKAWEALISTFAAHLSERYGLDEIRSWFFEVWNEPNLNYFWRGDKQEYMKLYRSSALALKSVDPELRVGGPATSVNSWIPDIIDFCKSTETPLDFISTHHYPSDDPLWAEGGMNFDPEELKNVDPEKLKEAFAQMHDRKYDRGVLTEMAKKAKEQASGYPLHYTEWNSAVKHDEPYAAAFTAKTLVDNQGLVDGYSYWTFSDIFEEMAQNSLPFHDGFGMMTIHGVPKPVYRLFELFHSLGDKRLPIKADPHPTVEALAVKKGGSATLILYNQNTPSGEIAEEKVYVSLENSKSKKATVLRIDDDHSNAHKCWLDMGSPIYPSSEQIDRLFAASEVLRETVDIEGNGFSLVLPPHGVAAVLI
ncbi:MAG: beta-xylosidase [Clostridiales bacterium]|nr:beta-xylosidase [Clostridiales bacterium]